MTRVNVHVTWHVCVHVHVDVIHVMCTYMHVLCVEEKYVHIHVCVLKRIGRCGFVVWVWFSSECEMGVA